MKELIINLQQTVIAALDTGKFNDITVDDIQLKWKNGQLINFLRERLKSENLEYCAFYMDSTKYDDLEAPLSKHFAAYLPQARKRSGVVNSGLCLVAGGLADFLHVTEG